MFYVCYQTSKKEYEEMIKKITGKKKVTAGEGNEGRVTGFCYETMVKGKVIILLWATSLPCLLHEIFHAVSFTLRCRFSLTDQTDEPYAYYYESVFRRIWIEIKKKR